MLGILEGHDARQGDVVTHVQAGTGHFGGFGETVKHPPGLGAGIRLAALAQNAQGVVGAAAGVDDQRLLRDLRRLDMRAETLALPFQIGNRATALAVFHAVVIETGLADGHHARQRGALHQVLHAGLGHVLGIGVHAHSGPEIVVVQRQLVHFGKLFHRRADAQRARDLGSSHGFADLRDIGAQLGEIQVTVGIGKHRNWTAPERLRRFPRGRRHRCETALARRL